MKLRRRRARVSRWNRNMRRRWVCGSATESTYEWPERRCAARVTSLREVRWDTFQPNFFVVFSPGALEQVTGTLITSVHVDGSSGARSPSSCGSFRR